MSEIVLSWDYNGWKETYPNLDSHSVQYDWNSTLLTMLNRLRLDLITKNEDYGLDYNSIKVNPSLLNQIFQNMLFYRVKGEKQYVGGYRIKIDESLQNNTILMYDKNNPSEKTGLITIENLN